MTSPPANALSDPDLLRVGHYVVVEIDPTASLARLEDHLVDAAAREIRPGRYVGLISEVWRWPDPDLPLVKVKLHLLGQGMPTLTASRSPPAIIAKQYAALSLPIAPTTRHPSRTPVMPSSPLPWPSTYHHTALSLTVRVTALDARRFTPISVSSDDLARLERCVRDDRLDLLGMLGAGVGGRLTKFGGSTVIPLTPSSAISGTFSGVDSRRASVEAGSQLAAAMATMIPPASLALPVIVQVNDDEDEDVTTPADLSKPKPPSPSPHGSPPADWPTSHHPPPSKPKLHVQPIPSHQRAEITAKLYLNLDILPALPDPLSLFEELALLGRLQKEAANRRRRKADEKTETSAKQEKRASRIRSWVFKERLLPPNISVAISTMPLIHSAVDLTFPLHPSRPPSPTLPLALASMSVGSEFSENTSNLDSASSSDPHSSSTMITSASSAPTTPTEIPDHSTFSESECLEEDADGREEGTVDLRGLDGLTSDDAAITGLLVALAQPYQPFNVRSSVYGAGWRGKMTASEEVLPLHLHGSQSDYDEERGDEGDGEVNKENGMVVRPEWELELERRWGNRPSGGGLDVGSRLVGSAEEEEDTAVVGIPLAGAAVRASEGAMMLHGDAGGTEAVRIDVVGTDPSRAASSSTPIPHPSRPPDQATLDTIVEESIAPPQTGYSMYDIKGPGHARGASTEVLAGGSIGILLDSPAHDNSSMEGLASGNIYESRSYTVEAHVEYGPPPTRNAFSPTPTPAVRFAPSPQPHHQRSQPRHLANQSSEPEDDLPLPTPRPRPQKSVFDRMRNSVRRLSHLPARPQSGFFGLRFSFAGGGRQRHGVGHERGHTVDIVVER